jgi:hypothetical protein
MTNEEADLGQRLELSPLSRRKRRTPCLRLTFTTQTEGEEKLAILNKMQAAAATEAVLAF